MEPPRRSVGPIGMHKRLIPLLFTVVLGAAACSSNEIADPGPPPPIGTTEPDERPDVDARSYYQDYEEADDEMSTGAVPTAEMPNPSSTTRDAGATTPVTPEPSSEPGPLDDNVFVDVGDSTFVPTTDDAESTFGLDVDTGSFSVGRTFLDMGVLPEPDSIRTEEWVNAFDYGDAEPTDTDLGVSVETHDAPRADDGTKLVRVSVSTRDLVDTERPTANVTFVIDTSGSMDIRERLGLVKSSLALLVQNLRADDTISIVVYGDEASPVLEPTPVSDAETIVDAIDDLEPGGSTNMEAGLLLGYQQARSAFRPDALNVVVLASDGVANVGVTDADVLTDQITQAGEEGIHLLTVGYGMGNYNDQLMEQLADQGDGFYAYVDTFEEAERLFVEELTPTLTVVAGDAKAQVVFDPDQVSEYRLIGYENRMLDDEDFRDDTVDAGELGAGHDVTALYEVRLNTNGPAFASRKSLSIAPVESLGEVRLRWASVETGEVEETTAPIAPSSGDEASDSFRFAATVADFAELLKGNSVVSERGVSLEQLATEAGALDEAGVEGAGELAEMIELAQDAS